MSQCIIPISDHSERHLGTHIQYVLLTHTHTYTYTLEPSQQSSVRFGSFEAKQKCGNVTALGDRLLAPWHPYYSPAPPPPPPPHPILPLLSSPLLHSPRQTHPPTTDTTFVTRTHADCHGISGSKLLLGLDVFNISISNNVSSLSAQRRGGQLGYTQRRDTAGSMSSTGTIFPGKVPVMQLLVHWFNAYRVDASEMLKQCTFNQNCCALVSHYSRTLDSFCITKKVVLDSDWWVRYKVLVKNFYLI